MRFVIEELAEDGVTVVRRENVETEERFELSLSAGPTLDFPLSSPLVVQPDPARELALLHYEGHRRHLAPGQPLFFSLPEVRLRLSLVGELGGGVSGGRGRCPRCNGTLRQQSMGGAYRSFARDLRRCERCQVEIVELADAGEKLGQFADATQNDWYWVAAPNRCPGCGNLMKRARLRTAKGEAEVERCIPCELLVLDDLDRRTLLAGDRW